MLQKWHFKDYVMNQQLFEENVSREENVLKAEKLKTKFLLSFLILRRAGWKRKKSNGLISSWTFLFVFFYFQFYYLSIIEDLILRFGWTLSMSLIEMGYIDSDLIFSILAPLEIFRRFIWNYFRLENEHLNNCGNFRAVRDIVRRKEKCMGILVH